jgi:hypothetical protein
VEEEAEPDPAEPVTPEPAAGGLLARPARADATLPTVVEAKPAAGSGQATQPLGAAAAPQRKD